VHLDNPPARSAGLWIYEICVQDRENSGGEYADMIPIPPPSCIHLWRGWGSAANPGPCPISANLFRVFFVNIPPPTRHPERSASQIDRLTQRLWRAVEGPRRCLCLPMLFGAFQPPSPNRPARYGLSPGAENQELANILLCPAPISTCSADPIVGLRWLKKLRTAWVR
jgi:hypothetical protein